MPQSDFTVFDFQDDQPSTHQQQHQFISNDYHHIQSSNHPNALTLNNNTSFGSIPSLSHVSATGNNNNNDLKGMSNAFFNGLFNPFMNQSTLSASSPISTTVMNQSYDKSLSLNDTIALALSSKDNSLNVLPTLNESFINNNITGSYSSAAVSATASAASMMTSSSSYSHELNSALPSPSGTIISGKSDGSMHSSTSLLHQHQYQQQEQEQEQELEQEQYHHQQQQNHHHNQSQSVSRSASARASKAAREKRKQMLNELIDENKKLLQEREQFLQKIDDLQTKIQEIRESEGDVDVFMENELLKSQLQEHKFFVSSLMKMASGVPTKQADRYRLYRQGADYGVTSFLSILDRSTRQILSENDNPWTIAPMEFTQSLGSSGGISCRYQFVDDAQIPDKKRLVLRFDHVRKDCKAADVADIYWSVWTNISLLKKVMDKDEIDILLHETLTSNEAGGNSNGAEASSSSSSTLTASPTESSSVSSAPKTLSGMANDLHKMTNTVEEALATSYMREKAIPPQVPKDWVFVSTKRKQTLSKRIFQVPLEDVSPKKSMGNDYGYDNNLSHPDLGKNVDNSSKKKIQKTNVGKVETKSPPTGAATHDGSKQRITTERVQCHIVTKCTTRHHESFSDESQNIKRNHITAMYLESCVMTDLEDGCHCCAVISVPANLQIGDLAFSDVIKNGIVSEVFISSKLIFICSCFFVNTYIYDHSRIAKFYGNIVGRN